MIDPSANPIGAAKARRDHGADASSAAKAWECRDNFPYPDGKVEYSIQRGTAKGEDCETAAICWDYGLACLIEAAMNLRDGTVD